MTDDQVRPPAVPSPGWPQDAPLPPAGPAGSWPPPAPTYGWSPAPVTGGVAMKRRNVVAVWLGLPLITFGIYTYVWYYKINAEMARFDPRRPESPGTSVLVLLFGGFLIVPPYVSVYNTGKRIAERQRVAGVGSSCSPVVGLLLCFFFGLWTLYYQSELNRISDHYGHPAEGTPVALVY